MFWWALQLPSSGQMCEIEELVGGGGGGDKEKKVGGGGGKYMTGECSEPDHLKVNSGMVKEKEPTLNTWALDP